MRILVVEADTEKARTIMDALSEAGWTDVRPLAQIALLAQSIKSFDPDIVLIDVANPDRDMLEHISTVSDTKARTVAWSCRGLVPVSFEQCLL